MNTKHTPGPWDAFKRGSQGVSNYTSIEKDRREFARVYHGDRFIDSEANARLIAAAPDLLEALRNALDVLGMNEYERESCRRRIREVLAKATEEK